MKKPLVAYLGTVAAAGVNQNWVQDAVAGQLVICEDAADDPLIPLFPPVPYGAEVVCTQYAYNAEVSKVGTVTITDTTVGNRTVIKVVEVFGDTGSHTPKVGIYAHVHVTGDTVTTIAAALVAKITAHGGAAVTAGNAAGVITLTDKANYFFSALNRGGITQVFTENETAPPVYAQTVAGEYQLGEGAHLVDQYPRYNRAVTDLESGVDTYDAIYGTPDATKQYDMLVITFEGKNRDHKAGHKEEYGQKYILWADDTTAANVTALIAGINATP